MSSLMGSTDFDALSKANFNNVTQTFLFAAHVESPLAGILKLSLYGVLRLILPLLPVATLNFTPLVYTICVITIVYASLSTLRTIDVKELIAYSSVAHAAVYLLGIFSNTIQGIEGGILLGLAHGLVSSGLFICAGGVLYDRTHTRLITFYRGVTSIMPIFSLLFFILALGNSGTPLTVNFIGEFLSLYGAFERMPVLGVLASSSIVFSAAFTIFMYNRVAFGGSLSSFFAINIRDVNKREFIMLFTLVALTVLFGIFPSPILDGLHYSVSTLIFSSDSQNLALSLSSILILLLVLLMEKDALESKL
ncbi:NADH dehydrogenase subunit 4 [Terfezia boudieri ATCC MYA-4762]|uniref:NADH dehydrogenase subunit 4 n=1 Tax=Terfezia boudieri ATCC MYA-4762 TaxID=1051890 RepID=A0A3N4L801_9PEZI|nr:NADH dehydrogenase subunit 4 [Terfezia boudieri ATCC MYA-4762]